MQTTLPSITHLKPDGGVRMVDVSGKNVTQRQAVAAGRVVLGEEAFAALEARNVAKGDVLTTAQLAGIMGAKETSRLIPLCHTVTLDAIDIEIELHKPDQSVDIRAVARTAGRTGVEMEALTAVTVAALAVYDMCKSFSKAIRIMEVRLISKEGGSRGPFRAA